MALGKLLRLSFSVGNRSFCRSDISRIQMKSNWKVGESLVASDQQAVWKSKLIWSKAQLFFLMFSLEIPSFQKSGFEKAFWWCHVALKELLRLLDGLENWCFCPSDMNSWWKGTGLWSMSSFRIHSNFMKSAMKCLRRPGFGIHSFWNKIVYEGVSWWFHVILKKLHRGSFFLVFNFWMKVY